MLTELKYFKRLHFCPETFEVFLRQRFLQKRKEINYTNCYIVSEFREQYCVAVCSKCVDKLNELFCCDLRKFDESFYELKD